MSMKIFYQMILAFLATTSFTFADDNSSGHGKGRLDVEPVTMPLYQEECGSCHFAYQPSLLPLASWRNIMNTLDKHYGENAELDSETQNRLLDYFERHAADRADFSRFSRVYRFETKPPEAISSSRYFVRQHNEIPERMVAGNPKVGSFAQCQACHLDAERGSFNEHRVEIPGWGSWDD